MTETELLAKIATNGWIVQRTEIEDTNPSLMRKAVLCWKAISTVVTQQWFHYFVKADSTAYWERSDPFPVAVITFRDELGTKIAALVTANTIKSGYIERIDETAKTAIVVVVNPSNAFATFHVYKDTDNSLKTILITGIYPI